MNTVETEKTGKDKSVNYSFRTFNVSMKGLKQHVGYLCASVHVLRKDMKTIEEINIGELDWTGECVAVMFYNSVVYFDVPSHLGVKTSWNEEDRTHVYHCSLLEGFSEPVYWQGREDHPNYKAYEMGFDFGSAQKWGCINGKPIDWFRWTDSISELDICVYEDGQKIIPLEKVGCYMCADNMKIHVESAKKRTVEDLDNRILYFNGLIVQAEEEINGYEIHKEYLEKARIGIQSLSPKEIWDKHPEFRR